MTTDPTARHHAQILDWLSAALTDPDTTMIYLHQDADEAGTWEIHADRKVDPAKEAAATSQADEDLLATYDKLESYLEKRYGQPDPAAWATVGDYPRPEWVDDALEDPDVVDLENSCQCDDCQRVGRLINSYEDGRVLPGFSGTEYLPSHGGFDLQRKRKDKDLRVAFYGFDSEAGVIYRVDTPEGVRRALEDLFRADDDDDEGDDR